MDIKFSCHIDDDPEYPWFSWLITGRKKWEGRLNKPGSKWTQLRPCDKIMVINTRTQESKVFTVVCTKTFVDFREAYDVLGRELVPGLIDSEKTKKLYEKFYTKEEVTRYGVICVKMIHRVDPSDLRKLLSGEQLETLVSE